MKRDEEATVFFFSVYLIVCIGSAVLRLPFVAWFVVFVTALWATTVVPWLINKQQKEELKR